MAGGGVVSHDRRGLVCQSCGVNGMLTRGLVGIPGTEEQAALDEEGPEVPARSLVAVWLSPHDTAIYPRCSHWSTVVRGPLFSVTQALKVQDT